MQPSDYLNELWLCLATLDDYDANMVNLVPCLVEDRVEGMHGKTVEQATKEELRMAREYVLKTG